MCGIAGIVALDGFDPQTLMAATHLVSYRGPDSFGFAYSRLGKHTYPELIHNQNRIPKLSRPQVGLGNRRLAILDVSRLGDQPMETEDSEYCLTFNGEIYNFKEIRQELEERGHRFHTQTDTEVILKAYREWGEDCVLRFNGMWSFALWDRPNQRLFCARDRFGVKPFYYAIFERRLFFGSEIKQILQASAMARTANANVVFNFLEYGLLDYSSETFFEGIHQLAGGHCLRLEMSDPLRCVVRRYWELRLEQQDETGKQDVTAEFQRRFEEAVTLRLRSDVPIGACLSGGLDSSSIVCEAKRVAPDLKLRTFSACFDEEALDERKFISAVTAAAGVVGHRTFPRSEDFWKRVSTMLWHQDEPVASTNVFAQWCVMEEARRHSIPVVLAGQGGDEILCGYQKYRYFYLWHLIRRRDPRILRESILGVVNGTRSVWALEDASRYFPPALRRLFSVAERLCTPELRTRFREARSPLGPGTSIQERQKMDLIHASIPSLLHYEDRNSMAHSVESRLPYLDYKLAEFAVNCPASAKLHDGWSKWMLRKALAGTLPDKIRLRKTKLGFDTPQAEWMRHGMQNGHRHVWDTPPLRMERFLSGPKLAHEMGKFIRAGTATLPAGSLFRAICLELWARVFAVS